MELLAPQQAQLHLPTSDLTTNLASVQAQRLSSPDRTPGTMSWVASLASVLPRTVALECTSGSAVVQLDSPAGFPRGTKARKSCPCAWCSPPVAPTQGEALFSGDTLDCPYRKEWCYGIRWVQAKGTASILQCTGRPAPCGPPAPTSQQCWRWKPVPQACQCCQPCPCMPEEASSQFSRLQDLPNSIHIRHFLAAWRTARLGSPPAAATPDL